MPNRTLPSRVAANEEAINSLKNDVSSLKTNQDGLVEKIIRMDETVKNQGQQQQIALENQNRTLSEMQRQSVENHKETQEFVKKLIGEYQDPVDKVFNRVEALSVEFKTLSNALLPDNSPKAIENLRETIRSADQRRTDKDAMIKLFKDKRDNWFITGMFTIIVAGVTTIAFKFFHPDPPIPQTQVTIERPK